MNRSIALAGLVLMTMTVALAEETSLKSTNYLTVPQWVSPETPGELTGRVVLPSSSGSLSTIADATVVMTNDRGASVRGKTDSQGKFKLSGVESGVYAMTARAKGVFACCAMHVVDGQSQFPSEVELSAAAIDYSLIKSSIIRYVPPAGKFSPVSIEAADFSSVSAFAVNATPFRVMQSDDGGLRGQIRLAGADVDTAGLNNVFLVQDGEIIDRVVTDESGRFQFEKVNTGDYSIMALGQRGMAMIGFELVGELEQVSFNNFNGQQTLVVQNTPSAPEAISRGQIVLPAGQKLSITLPNEVIVQIAPLPQAVESVEEASDEPLDEGVILEEGFPMADALPVDQFGNPISGFDQFGNPITGFDQFGNPISGSPGMGGLGGAPGAGGAAGGGALGGGGATGGGGFAGGGGAGAGGLGGGLGGLASLAGLAGIAAATSNDNNSGTLAPPPAASPAAP
ncbi:carboxypeptidase-like regulatory domain-containing protein [Neorhodopirellula pilleata]|uniref:Cna protein B-type domain protein n=1 Tax=Neorhodopirellula pilleata TaxID=2714738 RepID=A0A5C6AUT0_9BACT|nr:carboxypeptidase-like regulatory domain-containing protein [Neorhodopirellula pilleata]TWU03773.1 hypothetical protein Pla100_07030 [Neorhodopirellula pilleata]